MSEKVDNLKQLIVQTPNYFCYQTYSLLGKNKVVLQKLIAFRYHHIFNFLHNVYLSNFESDIMFIYLISNLT